jgi:DNA-binding MarR family transcriptional regulator
MFNRVLGQRLAVENLTPAQWFFLRALWERDGVSQRELSVSVGLTEPTTVSALRVMERRGLITRKRDKNDRRRSGVYLTKKGQALRQKLMWIPREVNAVGLVGESPEDVEHLIATLKRIRARLEAAVKD